MRSQPAELGSNRLSHCRTVAFVAAFVFGAGVPGTFDVIDNNVRAGDAAAETNVVKQEEFRFWSKQNGIRDTGGTQVLFSAFRDGARVAIRNFAWCSVPECHNE